MSDITSSISRSTGSSQKTDQERPYKIEETHWGYIVTAAADAGYGIRIAQTMATILGAAFLAAAIGLWLLPSVMFGLDAMFMRTFITVVFVSLAALFLWYASRGVVSEVQIDVSRGEIREVIRNKAGKGTVLGTYGFDSIGGVFLEPADDDEDYYLVLRFRSTGGCLVVANGREDELVSLRERISKDVVIG